MYAIRSYYVTELFVLAFDDFDFVFCQVWQCFSVRDPEGLALGVTMFLPEEDRYSLSKERLESQISSLFGGRIAESYNFV